MIFSKKKGREIKKKMQEGCIHDYQITIADEAFSELEQQSLTQLQGVVSLPGFRQGKVPFDMIKEKFSDKLREKMFSLSARNAIDEIIRDEKIVPVVTPLLSSPQFVPATKLGFSLRLECAPTFEITGYEKIKAVRKIREITNKEVEENVEQIRNYNAYLKPLTEDVPVGKEHYVVYDYEAYENEKRIDENCAKGEIVFMGNPGATIVNLPQNVLGARKGDVVEFDSEAGGRKLHFKVYIREIKEKILPKLDEAFLSQLGAKSVEELKENIEQMLKQQARDKTEKEIITQIEDELIKRNPFHLPPTLIEEENKELTEMFKKKAPQIAETMDEKTLKEKLRPAAERNLRVAYILNAVAKKENLQASEEDYNKELSKSLERLNSEEERSKISNVFAERKEYIMAMITENKAMDFIRSRADIKSVKI